MHKGYHQLSGNFVSCNAKDAAGEHGNNAQYSIVIKRLLDVPKKTFQNL